jgi:quercetin dioxygenase-like cupin family protein
MARRQQVKSQIPVLSTLLLVSVVVLAQQDKIGPDGNPVPVAVTEDPYHHLLFENRFARVFRVELPPQKATLLHKHPYDFMMITLADGDVESAHGIGTSLMTYDLHRGDARFVHGPIVHRMRNPEGVLTHRNITVEILRNSEQPYNYPSTRAGRRDYDVVPPPVDSHVSYQAMLDRDTVRASSVQILPKESLVVAKGTGPLLVVPLDDLELTPEGGEDQSYQRDAVLWDPNAFRQKLTNTGSRPARFILLEFK